MSSWNGLALDRLIAGGFDSEWRALGYLRLHLPSIFGHVGKWWTVAEDVEDVIVEGGKQPSQPL